MTNNKISSIRNYFYITYPINDFKDYAELIENNLKKKLQEFEQEASQYSEEEQEEYYEFYIDEWYSYRVTYAQTHRNSLFVTIYSFLEKRMFDRCKVHEDNSTSPIIINDLKGKGIDKYRLYLNKIAGIKIDNQLWEKVTSYQDVRNKIIHNNGELSKSDTTLKDKIEKLPGFYIDNDKIKLESNACIEFLNVVENLLLDIFNYKSSQ
ncbi:hypothetical protein [Alteribacillus sp. YIM 98480]|uniref:hypothetical protein n=1 Tax=Alteribacillus sp. YIM 98480 TaxID=2606599 RepID=UPI00131AEB33|nr:hypothetical protein [Alteribacillus sp. YIM 98480]